MSHYSATYEIQGASTKTLISTEPLSAVTASDANVIFITDTQIHFHHPAFFKGKNCIIIPAGESHKSIDTLKYILDEFIRLKIDRSSIVIGVGGGMITDLCGFAASIFKRGLKFGFIPTTLTAMVDASIGGKNGINFGLIKNMVGTFSQPEFIHIQPQFLTSLSDASWTDGFSEIIKHAAIGNIDMFNSLASSDLNHYRNNIDALTDLIFQNISFKSKLVEQDPYDSGMRNMLNFGHTLGHALEQSLGISHGKAVAIGMHFASWLSMQRTSFSHEEYEEVCRVLNKYQLPSYLNFDTDSVFDLLLHDKKKQGENIRFVLLEKIGKPVFQHLDSATLKSYISEWKNNQS